MHTKSVHNKWLHAWMDSAPCPPFFHFFIHLAASQQILPFMLPKFNISPGNHYPHNWNAFVGIFVMRSTWWYSNGVHKQTNKIFSNAPPLGNRKEAKSQWIYAALFVHATAVHTVVLMCLREWFFLECFVHCMQWHSQLIFCRRLFLWLIYKIIIYFCRVRWN